MLKNTNYNFIPFLKYLNERSNKLCVPVLCRPKIHRLVSQQWKSLLVEKLLFLWSPKSKNAFLLQKFVGVR